MATHEEVVRNFAQRKVNRRTGDVSWHGRNVYCEGNCLYSYGRHFVLAVHLGPSFFLKNGDRYSVTTAGHQAATQRYCEGPTASFSALSMAGFVSEHMQRDNILDYDEGTHKRLIHTDEGYFLDPAYESPYEEGIRFIPPNQGMYVPIDENRGYWHILGGLTLQHNGRYFLSALDRWRYFVSELPEKPISVGDAYEILKPLAVKRAEDAGLEILRQGEWFFICGLTDRDMADRMGVKTLKEMYSCAETKPLPHVPISNRHICKQITVNDKIYATGMVRHVGSWSNASTGDHLPVRLGNLWYQVVHNTALHSWSLGGRFD